MGGLVIRAMEGGFASIAVRVVGEVSWDTREVLSLLILSYQCEAVCGGLVVLKFYGGQIHPSMVKVVE